MRIYFSDGQDPMLLDSLAGMKTLHEQLVRFIESDETVLTLAADHSGLPRPYSRLLLGFQIRKAVGPIRLELTPQRWLSLSGSKENLARYVAFFQFDDSEEGAHHHPEHVHIDGYLAPGSMSLIIEVDSNWIEEVGAEE
jgi:hypothetical protein